MKKKYQKHIIFIGIAIIIYWFFSSQYDYYLEADTIKFEFITRIKIAGVTLLILFLMQYKLHDYEKIFFKRFVKSIFYSVALVLIFYLVFESFIKSGGLLINRFSSKEMVEKPFEITYKKGNNIEFKSLFSERIERTENKFNQKDLIKIKKGDTIYIEFHKGLFGKKYSKSKKFKINFKE